MPAAGSASRATWKWRSTSRGSATTAPARASSGTAGDFVTAPEVAPVFSRCLAGQCAEVLAAQGGGDVLELGAGSGAMAAAMLAELESLGALPARYRILDVSADLRERQRATLAAAVPRLLDRVEWLDRLPERFEGVVVANEVLDALPVERFAWRGGEARALGVASARAGFEWARGARGSRARAPRSSASAATAAATGPTATSRRSTRASRPGSRPSPARSSAAWCCSSTTACRAASSTRPSEVPARCSATSATASTTIRSRGRDCRTSPRGWTSPRSPRPRSAPASRWRATRRRRTS